MTSLDIPIPRVQVDRAKVHHESLVIDFSQLDEGDTGIISFGFGWYLGDRSYVPGQNGIILGNDGALYYYKGQQGIYLSMGGYEMVKEQCEKGAPASVIDVDFNKLSCVEASDPGDMDQTAPGTEDPSETGETDPWEADATPASGLPAVLAVTVAVCAAVAVILTGALRLFGR